MSAIFSDTIDKDSRVDVSTFLKHESGVRSYCRDFPALLETSKGAVLTDVEGKKYIDFFTGAGALNYGHNDESMKLALIDYISSNGITHSLDFYTSAKKEFIDSFHQHILVPRGLSYKFQFTGPTGTNAIEAALKLARKATGRTNVVAFTNAFHGMSMGALSATTNPKKRKGAGLPLNGVTFMPYDGYLGEKIDSFDVMARLLEAGGGIDSPAAFIFETIQGEGGLRVASMPWAKQLEQLARSKGALMIVDDIQAGCGRSGNFFSFETLGITPDIVCLSKSISGYGLPMALNLVNPAIDGFWEPGEHNGTFRGNNLAFITARAAIEKYWSSDDFAHALHQKSANLDQHLRLLSERLQQNGIMTKIVGRGFMKGIEFQQHEMAEKVSAAAFIQGLLV